MPHHPLPADVTARFPVAEFGFPEPLRDRLVQAIVEGKKTGTSTLALEYKLEGIDPMSEVGNVEVVVDSNNEPVCLIRTTSVEILPLKNMTLERAVAEGEGFTSVEQWEAAHREFWKSEEFRQAIGKPDFSATPITMIAYAHFSVITAN